MQRALFIGERWSYAFYDSLIVAAAVQARAPILYSEDLSTSSGSRACGSSIRFDDRRARLAAAARYARWPERAARAAEENR